MGDQNELKKLRQRLDKLEEAHNKDKKKRASLIALLRLTIIKAKQVYDLLKEQDE